MNQETPAPDIPEDKRRRYASYVSATPRDDLQWLIALAREKFDATAEPVE